MSIGAAMIVRDGAATMEAALDPFMGRVSEISIVLGGPSQDASPDIAKKYATVLSEFNGPFHFGRARQQAYDQLTTTWAVTVDADDIWSGLDYLDKTIERAEELGSPAIEIICEANGEFSQGRIHKREAGQWVGAIHEFWRPYGAGKSVIVDTIRVKQQPVDKSARRAQNVAMAEAWLKENPVDLRAMALLCRDYTAVDNESASLVMAENYLAAYGRLNADRPGEYFNVRLAQAVVLMNHGEYERARDAMIAGLGAANYSSGWAVLGEINQRQARRDHNNALQELAIYCADRAISGGKTRSAWLTPPELITSGPCCTKANALTDLGRGREAVAALDIGLAFEPGHEGMTQTRRNLCAKLGILP